MQVPLLDLKAQYATLKEEMMREVEAVMDSQYFINGPWVGQLEKEIAEYCDTAASIGVSSGTDALLVSLMALDIKEGDEVITTPFTFFATVGSIWRVGAKPVFVDIDPKTYNIDPALIEAAITPRTKAIMPVHIFGQCADMDPILEIAKKHNLHVIEDACQAIGSKYKGQRAGSMGDTGCFSFFPSKNLGGLGDGGIVTTNDENLATKLRQCRNHGMEPAYIHKWVGGNFRLDSLQAAGLSVKLKHLESWHEARRKNAAFYDQQFADIEEITTPFIHEDCETVYNQYVIRVPQRDKCLEFLRSNGVGCAVYYPLSLHMQECFLDMNYKEGDFPICEKACEEVIALPVYPELTSDQLEYVVAKVKEFIASVK